MLKSKSFYHVRRANCVCQRQRRAPLERNGLPRCAMMTRRLPMPRKATPSATDAPAARLFNGPAAVCSRTRFRERGLSQHCARVI